MVESSTAPNSPLDLHSNTHAELQLLKEILRETRTTVLYAPAGMGKTALLHAQIVPWRHRTVLHPGNSLSEITVVFDSWAEALLVALRDCIQRSLVAAFGRKAMKPPITSSLAQYLRAWCCAQLGVKLLIVFDQFERYLLAPPEQAGNTAFAEEWVRATNLPDLAVNFLIIAPEIVSGIKRVEHGPASTDLRYFRAAERDEAQRVLRALLEASVPVTRIKRITGYETSAIPRQYELWLASDWQAGQAYR